MSTQTTGQQQWQILRDLYAGTITRDEARALLREMQMMPEFIEPFLEEGLRMLDAGLAPGGGGEGEQPPTPGTTTPSGLRGLEEATDPQTAYLERLGLGGKQFYNPAERYQAQLFDPYMNLYNMQQHLFGPESPMVDPSRTTGTFAEFIGRQGTGQGSLLQTAQGQLRDIFGAPPSMRGQLGFEPGQYPLTAGAEAAGTLDPGEIESLGNLMRYGLRSTFGPSGARAAQRALPQAQQAYYGQKAAGTAGAENFLDWLKKNWQLAF